MQCLLHVQFLTYIPPVSIYGEMYSDGGINDPEYPIANAVNTPVEPMNKYELDAVIIIYLSDEPKLVSPERYKGNIIFNRFHLNP